MESGSCRWYLSDIPLLVDAEMIGSTYLDYKSKVLCLVLDVLNIFADINLSKVHP